MKKTILYLLFMAWTGSAFPETAVENLFQKTTDDRMNSLKPLLLKAKEAQKIQNPDKMEVMVVELQKGVADLSPSLKSTEMVGQVRNLIASMYVAMGESAATQNQWNRARDCALNALRENPDSAGAKELMKSANEMLGRGTVRGQAVNPATSDKFFDKLEAVRDGLATGTALRETGQLEKADESFQRVLQIDPFNKAAIAELKKLEDERLLTSNKLRDTAFQQKKREVRDLWDSLEKVRPKTARSSSINPEALAKGDVYAARLADVKNIPEVNFPGLDLGAVIQSLNALQNKFNTSGPKIVFIASDKLEGKEIPPIHLKLRNVNLLEVVQYVEKISGLKYRANLNIYEFGPLVMDDELVARTFPRVNPSFFPSEKEKSETKAPTQIRGGAGFSSDNLAGKSSLVDAQEYLAKLGVDFSNTNSQAVWNPNSKVLQVVNTTEMCDLVGELIAAHEEDTLLIRIDCRLVEINQNDLDSLTANTTLGGSGSALLNVFPQGYIPTSSGSTPNPSLQQGVTMQLNQIQGVGLLPNNTIQSFLAPGVLAGPNQASTYDINTMQFGGPIMGGMQFRTLISAISQKSSANVLASPSIVLKRGGKGVIEVSQAFRFVKQYNEPQSSVRTFIPSGAASGQGGTVTPIPGPETVLGSFPSDLSDPEDIGVKLGVIPDIAGENKDRVQLDLEPQFVDFEGFINYGAVINSSYAATYFGQATPIVTNNIQQPVFVRRDLALPRIEVRDGYTLALAGLLREDIQTIDEKVPIFGDIPLLGRAFQGKTQQAIKKNTLIFVSPTILRTDGSRFNPESGFEAGPSNSGPNLVSSSNGTP